MYSRNYKLFSNTITKKNSWIEKIKSEKPDRYLKFDAEKFQQSVFISQETCHFIFAVKLAIILLWFLYDIIFRHNPTQYHSIYSKNSRMTA